MEDTGCFLRRSAKFVCVDGPEFNGHKIDYRTAQPSFKVERICMNEERITSEKMGAYLQIWTRLYQRIRINDKTGADENTRRRIYLCRIR